MTDPSEWSSVVSHAAGLGFDAIAAPSIDYIGSLDDGNLCVGRDSWSSITIADFVALAERHGLKAVVDVRIDLMASGSRLGRSLGLDKHTSARAIDPRIGPEDRGGVPIDYSRDGVGDKFKDAALSLLRRLVEFGVSGFRCVKADAVPAHVWRHVIDGVAMSRPQISFIASGLNARPLASQWLEAAGFDALLILTSAIDVTNSLDKWRRRYGDADRRVYVCPEAPFGPRAASGRESAEITERRLNQLLWTAAATEDGFLMPMGFEFGTREKVPARGAPRKLWDRVRADAPIDLSTVLTDCNALLRSGAEQFDGADFKILPTTNPYVLASARIGVGDPSSRIARVVLINKSLDRSATIPLASVFSELGEFQPFKTRENAIDLYSDDEIKLRPGEVRVLEGSPGKFIKRTSPPTAQSALVALRAPRLALENITPSVDDGRYPVKRVVGDVFRVEADAYGEGHDPVAIALKWRAEDETTWRETRMRLINNDRWFAEFPLERVGRYFYAVEVWRDEFATLRSAISKKHEAGQDVSLELQETSAYVKKLIERASGDVAERLKALARELQSNDGNERVALVLDDATADLMEAADKRMFSLLSEQPFRVDSERRLAAFASWYELFPRSQSGDATKHGTFDDVIHRLPAIRDMGFDVVYFPPIHPIGSTNRKGRENSLTAAPDDPGSPYAIGSPEGGHDAIHRELGTLADFRALVAAASELDMEIALDIAIQASPDHPWLTKHPEWFDWRPDGTVRYAENPPKKYEDIVNVHFYGDHANASLWLELLRVVNFWVDQGVKLFRVDNPHTKPFPFWEWLIDEVRGQHPEVVFLSEAFTRPKVMYRLAKIGFSQSYTYFTWRNAKWELMDYLRELTTSPASDVFRPHFFVNTHDINPDFLQNAPRSAYLIRAALAATLSGLWGMYNGFELCEGRPDAKFKEYAESEKYELRAWDWDRPGNIISEISRLNAVRRENLALHTHLGLEFLAARNDNIIYFEKATPGRENVLLIAINLDPFNAREADIELPLWKWSLPDNAALVADDLMRGYTFTWSGKNQNVRLDPANMPFSVWRVRPLGAV